MRPPIKATISAASRILLAINTDELLSILRHDVNQPSIFLLITLIAENYGQSSFVRSKDTLLREVSVIYRGIVL